MKEPTDWLPVEGRLVALVPRVLFDARVNLSEPHMVRGRDERGLLMQVPLEYLDGESRRRVREALEAEGGCP